MRALRDLNIPKIISHDIPGMEGWDFLRPHERSGEYAWR
ncbi:unnamed protein product, partial [Allacma fusca]